MHAFYIQTVPIIQIPSVLIYIFKYQLQNTILVFRVVFSDNQAASIITHTHIINTGGSRGAHPARAPPRSPILCLNIQILRNVTVLGVGAPLRGGRPLREILDPPLINPQNFPVEHCKCFKNEPAAFNFQKQNSCYHSYVLNFVMISVIVV